MERKNVLFVFGGVSPEHDVSCYSASGLISRIDREKYNVFAVGITKEGRWFYTEASSEKIGDAKSWLSDESNKAAVILPGHGENVLLLYDDNIIISRIHIDVVFPVLHGENGEDGTIQGLLEICGIPYVGCDVCASSCCMDKVVTYKLVSREGILCPRCYSVSPKVFNKDPNRYVEEAEKFHSGYYPIVVKPSMTGSSVGVSVVYNREELKKSMLASSDFMGQIMVEEYIKGQEIKVALLGNDPVTVGTLCETVIEDSAINDYDLKYKSNGTHKKIPPEISDELKAEISRMAILVFEALGCRAIARVDFFLKDGRVFFNEINTIPGLSEKSIYSLMFADIGIGYTELIDRLIESAFTK